MKALLLRVGIDKTYGALSPVFADYTYKYIPIYYQNKKEVEKNERRTYRDLGLETYLPINLREKIVHLDPEFEMFTYGDPGRVKRSSLLKLVKGDLLVFYIGGKEIETNGREGCFVIGYFVVDKVFDWNVSSERQRGLVKDEFKENAHIISSKSKSNLVIVKGSNQSKKLKKCIPITEPNKKAHNPPYVTSVAVQRSLGIREFIVRAIPIWIDEPKYLKNLQMMLGR